MRSFVLGYRDSEVGELHAVNVCGAVGHRLTRILNLRVSDNVSERFTAEHLHDKPVKADAHAAVRRCAVFEGVKQVAEL